jgi:hypothetical protein
METDKRVYTLVGIVEEVRWIETDYEDEDEKYVEDSIYTFYLKHSHRSCTSHRKITVTPSHGMCYSGYTTSITYRIKVNSIRLEELPTMYTYLPKSPDPFELHWYKDGRVSVDFYEGNAMKCLYFEVGEDGSWCKKYTYSYDSYYPNGSVYLMEEQLEKVNEPLYITTVIMGPVDRIREYTERYTRKYIVNDVHTESNMEDPNLFHADMIALYNDSLFERVKANVKGTLRVIRLE